MIAAMRVQLAPAAVADIHQVLADHHRYWGERDLRSLHLLALVQEFGSTCLVARAEDGIRGYVIGFVTPAGTGYVHLAATRDDTRGTGLGRRLYGAFADAAHREGALRMKAVTSVGNTGSIAFHRRLGFDAEVIEDYNGPGRAMVVFHRDLPIDTAQPWPAGRRPRPIPWPPQRAVVHEVVDRPLLPSRASLAPTTGLQSGTRQLREIIIDATRDVRDFYAQRTTRIEEESLVKDLNPSTRRRFALCEAHTLAQYWCEVDH
jgi:GNAT superfamily N-acetyltransferase